MRGCSKKLEEFMIFFKEKHLNFDKAWSETEWWSKEHKEHSKFSAKSQ
jgi:hypothetical protein